MLNRLYKISKFKPYIEICQLAQFLALCKDLHITTYSPVGSCELTPA